MLSLTQRHSPFTTSHCYPLWSQRHKFGKKIDVLQFKGNILSWTRFWEQFHISVHEHPSLSDTEKFVYPQQALKSGSAKSSTDGLLHSGDNYSEAIACLKARYDRPRLIH